MEYFETHIYKPNPEKPGYSNFERMATTGELFQYCKKALDKAGVSETLEYFDLMNGVKADDPLPRGLRWLVVFVVTGGSEGFYIHIEAIADDKDLQKERGRKLIILGKELSNKMDNALKAVNVLAPLLS